MRTCALQSGSNGNCIYVESDGVRLLFDAGISGRQAAGRLRGRGGDIGTVDALILSHDHADHVRCAGIYHRKFGLPIHATEPTLARVGSELGALRDVRHFESGETLQFGHVCVETIPTPHDAVDGVAFVVDDGRVRLGIFTDLGHIFPGLGERLATVDACYLESNYDEEMLRTGPYPAALQHRIRGRGGHLSNADAAELVRTAAGERLRLLVLAHLSEQNNHPDLARDVHRDVVGETVPLEVASRFSATIMFDV